MSACAGNILKEMTESFIGAELLSGCVPDGKLRIGCPFTVPQFMGQAALLHSTFRICTSLLPERSLFYGY